MPTTPDIEHAARALLDSRLEVLRKLASARDSTEQARQALTAAERAEAAAHTAALRAGWTEEDLRRVGLEPPARRTPGRPRGHRTVASEHVAAGM